MTASECLSKADHCERMAHASNDHLGRSILLATAQHWRTLARTAKLSGSGSTERQDHTRTVRPSVE